MTKWKEEFDERYVVPFDDGTNDKFINVNPEILKDFISNLIEKLIEDIPDTEFLNENVMGKIDLTLIKQELRDKWLNN